MNEYYIWVKDYRRDAVTVYSSIEDAVYIARQFWNNGYQVEVRNLATGGLEWSASSE